MKTGDIINKMALLNISKRNNRNAEQDRIAHNKKVRELQDELNELLSE